MKQYKIGIVGTENYHAHEFTCMFNKPDESGIFRYPDCHVTMVYGHYAEESEKRVKEDGADAVAKSIEEMVENVDAAIITARDGKFHYEFAKPFIEAKKPVFVDKPFTVSPEEAIELINLARENNVPLCGGSSLKYSKEVKELKKIVEEADGKIAGGNICAPLDFESIYSGFYFYASHLTEMTLEIFGWNPKTVMAGECNGNVCAIAGYDNFNVTNNYNNGIYKYSGNVCADDAIAHKTVTLDGCFEKECELFVEMIKTGKMPYTYEQLAMPVFYMNAVMESVKTGKTVKIEETI